MTTRRDGPWLVIYDEGVDDTAPDYCATWEDVERAQARCEIATDGNVSATVVSVRLALAAPALVAALERFVDQMTDLQAAGAVDDFHADAFCSDIEGARDALAFARPTPTPCGECPSCEPVAARRLTMASCGVKPSGASAREVG